MRHTDALVRVAVALCSAPEERHWGYPLTKITGLRTGTLYPLLASMLTEGWLTDGWEVIDPVIEKRPPRRYYELTPAGLMELGAVVRRAEAEAASRKKFGRTAFV